MPRPMFSSSDRAKAPPEWVRSLAFDIDCWVQEPEVHTRFSNEIAIWSALQPGPVDATAVRARTLRESLALLGAVHDRYSNGAPLVADSIGDYDHTRLTIAFEVLKRQLPELLASPKFCRNVLRRAVRQVMSDLRLPVAEYQGTAEALELPVENVGPTTPELAGEEKALALLVAHPDWSASAIAEKVPCQRRTLYKWKRFQKALNVLKRTGGAAAGGTKSGDGKIEAWGRDRDRKWDDDRE